MYFRAKVWDPQVGFGSVVNCVCTSSFRLKTMQACLGFCCAHLGLGFTIP